MGLIKCNSRGALMCSEPIRVGCGGSLMAETITPEKPVKLRVFTFKELDTATNGFSNEAFMGNGSHGSVYKGTLRDGRLVAVKRQEFVEDKVAFDNELEILSTLHSDRFVNLVGFCKDSEDHEKLLVVDFMPNGTLHDILHYCPEPLAWALRAHLALQIAKSINALHSASPPVIHRDIKSANILIDGRWNAKLGDFGLALRGHIEDVLKHPIAPAGTVGYIDPSYETPGRVSTKSDVFSFGVLLLELISGREAVDTRFKPPHIIDWALPLINQGKARAVLDPDLPVSPQNAKALRSFVEIAGRCVRRASQKRPSMANVAKGLAEISAQVPLPAWIGLAGVMKRGHMRGPEMPSSRDFLHVRGLKNHTKSDRYDVGSARPRISHDGHTNATNFYLDLSNIMETSREFSISSSRDHQSCKDSERGYENQQHHELPGDSSELRKIRRDSRENSRDHVREQQPRSHPGSRGPSREHSRPVSREHSKEWCRDHSRVEHSERSTDLSRELTRDVVEASLNHIRKWRNNCTFDNSKSADKSQDKSAPEKNLELSAEDSKNTAAARSKILPSLRQMHRRNKSDGSISFQPEDLLSNPKDAEGPWNLKKRSSSGRVSRRLVLKAKDLIKEKEQKGTPIIWSY